MKQICLCKMFGFTYSNLFPVMPFTSYSITSSDNNSDLIRRTEKSNILDKQCEENI